MANYVVEAQGIGKKFGDQWVVDGVDLNVTAGECVALLGPNGAGKTTTLRMLLGLTRADRGELNVLGHCLPAEARQMHRRLGVVPQQDALDPDFTVAENLRVYAGYFGISAQAFAPRLEWLLDFANLDNKRDARIDALSGGMKRRLALARALVNDPELVILDEPTTGLDPQARQLIWQRLRGELRRGRTLILTTHYMDEAQRLCDRIAIMDHGKILACDTPQRLIAHHIEPHVVEIYGDDLATWQAGAPRLWQRSEQVGETLFCYTQEITPLLESLSHYPRLTAISRPANLEDLFLKLTGRDLRE
jgi:lipooligosaccharide transport system ATP-binding protein